MGLKESVQDRVGVLASRKLKNQRLERSNGSKGYIHRSSLTFGDVFLYGQGWTLVRGREILKGSIFSDSSNTEGVCDITREKPLKKALHSIFVRSNQNK